MPVTPVVSSEPAGRRRRPSGEPPPLPHHVDRTVRWYLAALVAVALLELAVAKTSFLARVDALDDPITRAFAAARSTALTRVAVDVDAVLTGPTLIAVTWATIAALIATRRVRHLLTYLVVWLAVSLLTAELAAVLGRPRPAGVVILADWHGYAHPSRPITALAMVLAGALYTLVPVGRPRVIYRCVAAALLGLEMAARVYLGVDAFTDALAGLAFGWALPVVAYRLITPHSLFPLSYHTRRSPHLELTPERRQAITRATGHQLGITVERIEPCGFAGSAGSTPLRLQCRGTDGTAHFRFAKLYALSHLRSDRWYKLARTVLYGRLEDEKPFSTVRRLVMYEDHLLRLLRDSRLPTPQPYGVAEITPEREYVILMEFFDGAEEIGSREVTDEEIDDGLRIVRRLWDAGVAHRDIKPSNLLVRQGKVLLIDVAFASLRPTPWRQAVDLANMMLTLALSSGPDRVYARALRQFAPEDVAEAFAATRSIALPTQLRTRLRERERDGEASILRRFRSLAPPRKPVPIQLWSWRRLAASIGVLLLAMTAVAAAVLYVRVAGLAGAGGSDETARAAHCSDVRRLAAVAEAVPTAAYLPCLETLPAGWSVTDVTVKRGSSHFALRSDRAPGRPVTVTFRAEQREPLGLPTTPRAAGARTYLRLTSISPRYAGMLTDAFPGGYVTYRFDFARGPHIALMEELSSAVALQSRLDVRRAVAQQLDLDLDP